MPISDEEFEASIDQNFTTVLSNGDEVALCEGGEQKRVTKENIDEFINLVLKARFSETTEQNKAIQDGLNKVFMGKLGAMSYLTPDAVEVRACGPKEIDVDRLKSITKYDGQYRREGDKHPVIVRFWRVMTTLSEAEKSAVVAFSWGRSRLPTSSAGMGLVCFNIDDAEGGVDALGGGQRERSVRAQQRTFVWNLLWRRGY